MAKTRSEQIHNRIERIKTELVAIDEMRPGSVSKQFKEPDLERGAYYQLNYSQAGEVELSMSRLLSYATFAAKSATTSGSKR